MSLVSPDIIKMINPRTLEKLKPITTVFQETVFSDLRSAGDCAQESGAHFESITYDILSSCNTGRYYITKEPRFNCHFDLPRKGDFQLSNASRNIHIECKQLGNAESHFDKLSHCLLNLIARCYGNEFWLVYDYNREIGNKNKIHKLITRCQEVKKQVALQGITFECILIDDLPSHLQKI